MKYLKKFESWGSQEAQDPQGQEEHDAYYDDEPSTTDEVAQKWYDLLDNDFFFVFLEAYPSKKEFEDKLSTYNMSEEEKNLYGDKAEVYMLETEFNSFPGEDEWIKFCSELSNVGW
jgi:hypothetical protein